MICYKLLPRGHACISFRVIASAAHPTPPAPSNLLCQRIDRPIDLTLHLHPPPPLLTGLQWLQEAEIKHCRICMLAFVGIWGEREKCYLLYMALKELVRIPLAFFFLCQLLKLALLPLPPPPFRAARGVKAVELAAPGPASHRKGEACVAN